ncbi:MAG: glutamine--fructose-6-phosphate transaminase (isomerizing) [Pirellulaceae bacterium]|jgi:glucosamine--fructose-6-phosphate aminotransferase (isomerizing)
MCGIVGYIGSCSAVPFLLEGLRRLEYRGYDSSGVAILSPAGKLERVRSVGRIEQLARVVADGGLEGGLGIGHTRWATHGPATRENAHPHFGGDGSVAVVHNGVIENYQELRDALESRGVRFDSQTDTEVIAHLIAYALESDDQFREPMKASPSAYARLLQGVLEQLRGTYGLAVLFKDRPDFLLAARLGSPLVIGLGRGELFLSSDTAPLAGHTDRIITLVDHQIAIITARSIQVIHRDHGTISPSIQSLDGVELEQGLDGYPNFMLKEIFQQPEAIRNALRGRLDRTHATSVLGGLNLTPMQLRQVDRLILTGCGTSWHAALIGEYMIEELARLPVEVEYASELRYRNPPVDRQTVVFGISQSGETADTLAAIRELKRKGHPSLAICNHVGSSISREADGGVYLHAGPEIGVASTKAFTSQVVILALLGLHFGRMRHLSFEQGIEWIEALERLPEAVQQALETREQVFQIAEEYQDASTVLYLGRHCLFPTALEGALKLKEISYLHAEGYPAAEMKHGPIALVEPSVPSVFLLSKGPVYDKVMSNLQEVKARGGPVIAITDFVDRQLEQLADRIVQIPSIHPLLQPIVTVIPLQLLAYKIAMLRGCDVDKPRNLAKSVTVE